MKLFANEEAFQLALKRLNALTPVWDWHPKISRKVHEDIFGVQIKLREIYFKKQVRPVFSLCKKTVAHLNGKVPLPLCGANTNGGSSS